MKRIVFMMLVILCSLTASAQPRPYEIDPSFTPTLEFMQKSWSGEYDGLEPNSRIIISISRVLVLNNDMTYSNEVKGRVKDGESVLLKYENGTYQYSDKAGIVTFSIDTDSTVDINNYLQGIDLSYVVNHYKTEGKEKTSTEKAQFTFAANDVARQWVLFDQQLFSPIDPRQKAVYVMTGKELESSHISSTFQNRNANDIFFDLSGRRLEKPGRGLMIVNGRKVIY